MFSTKNILKKLKSFHYKQSLLHLFLYNKKKFNMKTITIFPIFSYYQNVATFINSNTTILIV